MYKTEGRVRYSECGTDNRAKLSAIINYLRNKKILHTTNLHTELEFCNKINRKIFCGSMKIFYT